MIKGCLHETHHPDATYHPEHRVNASPNPARRLCRILMILALGPGFLACDAGSAPDATPSWHLEEDLRIGSMVSEGPDLFGHVVDVHVDRLRRIWVIDGPSHEIRVFDGDGTFVRTVGREGQGPGELELPTAMEPGPDGNVWVADSRNGRWEVFDTAGTPVARHPFAAGMMQFGDRWGPDGLLYTHVWLRTGSEAGEVIVRRRLEDGRLAPVDTLAAPQPDRGRTANIGFVRDGKRMTLLVPVPFQALRQRLLIPGEGWWLSHPGSQYRLGRIDLAGDTTLVVERDYAPVSVTEEDREAALSKLPPEHGLTSEDLPAEHPPVISLLTLPDGHLLVRRRSTDGEAFDVFDAAGSFVSSIPIPDLSLQVLSAQNDALYGSVHGDMDVPYVVRLRLRR